jgi:CRISPR-associated protein Csm5
MLDEYAEKRLADFGKDARSRMGRSWFREQFKQWFAQELDRHFFQRYHIGREEKRFSSRSDVMRAVKVSDARPLDKDGLNVEEIKIHSARSSHSPKEWSIYAECAQNGSEFTFDVAVDKSILGSFAESASQASSEVPFRVIEEIVSQPLEAVAHMTKALYAHERDFYEKESMPVEALDFRGITPNFRLGWGIGLLGTSVSLLLPDKVLQDIRNVLFTDRGEAPAPKSRKTALTTTGNASLGWCFAEQEK